MREILFRGKRLDNGEWVHGAYSAYDSRLTYYNGQVECEVAFMPSIIAYDDECFWYHVDPATVGQYTGLTDKNGKRIFEGDIVKQTFEKTVSIVSADLYDGDEYEDLYGEDVGVVVILPSKGACIKNPVIHREINGEITQDGEVAKMYKNICSGRCEIIGNIHDNPELLEGGVNDG